MSDQKALDLYEHLPALYRIQDAERGYPLRAFLEIISEQANILKQDIDGLWDDLFIETCAEWVIPYIGDVVGNNPLHTTVKGQRVDVAKTIYYRRRKGTLPMLEELARDVTEWHAHAAQFFEVLGWTQNANHLRRQPAPNPQGHDPEAADCVGTVNLRNLETLDRLDGPFDTISHTVDVRPIARVEGWHNIRNVGFFIWRLTSYPMAKIPALQSNKQTYAYHFSPLGNPAPLYNNPQREADETGLATEIHVPGPIRPLALHFDLKRARAAIAKGEKARSDYVGSSFSIKVVENAGSTTRVIPPEAIACMDLKTWRQPKGLKYKVKQADGSVIEKPIQVGIDASLGRFVFATGQEPKTEDRVEILYHYGFSADIGGGQYDRCQSLADTSLVKQQIVVAKGSSIETIQDALNLWKTESKPPCIIRIVDSEAYGGNLDIELPKDGWLVIEAADGVRPNVRLVGKSTVFNAPDAGATLIINGLTVEGGFELKGGIDFQIRHCTLVPGRMLDEDGQATSPDRDSLLVVGEPSSNLAVTIDESIVGPLRLPATAKHLTIRDSIVQALPVKQGTQSVLRPAIAADDLGTEPGPATTMERVTIWGQVHVREMTASEVIFASPVKVQRQQEGCVRFSYVPKGSQTPPRYRCQPDLALEGVTCPTVQNRIRARLTPSFTSEHYGDPSYAQLGLTCAKEILTGAEDGSEMGVFCSLKQPQRETNLRIRLEEYLPFGLEAGLIYVT